MKQLSLIAGFLFVSLFVSAQKLVFNKTEHNFQQIKETEGEVNCVFSYENKSKTPVIIVNVENTNRSSLRIAAKNDTVLPKMKGEITIILNPRNLSGSFNNVITVKTIEAGQNFDYLLKISADIEPRPRKIEEIYGMKEGNLRYKNNVKNNLKFIPTSVFVDTFFFYNEWTDTMTFSQGNLPAAVEIVYLTPKLAPLKEGILVFSYKMEIKKEWGNVYDKFTMRTNDSDRADKTFYIVGDVYDDFDSWTPQQKANAPKVSFDKLEYQFDAKTEGDEVIHDFIITNAGKSVLYIRRLKQSCGCTAVKPEKEELKPGESTAIKTIFRTHGKTGKQIKTIDVITNDPSQPKTTLTISGYVNPKQKTE
jgi:hypothetical protein